MTMRADLNQKIQKGLNSACNQILGVSIKNLALPKSEAMVKLKKVKLSVNLGTGNTWVETRSRTNVLIDNLIDVYSIY